MATTSFKKEFVIQDEKAVKRLKDDIAKNASTVSYEKKDAITDKLKRDNLLARLALA